MSRATTETLLPSYIIDVIIPAHPKDLDTLTLCIKQVRKHVANIRRIIVISPTKIIHDPTIAENITDDTFPFSISDISILLPDEFKSRAPWYFQQLAKLHVFQFIPNLTENVLILDADVIFLKRTTFVMRNGKINLTISQKEFHPPYFKHFKRLFPDMLIFNPGMSGIAHHMVFSRTIIKNIIDDVSRTHPDDIFWRTFIRNADNDPSGASEYEIYFNYALTHHNNMVIARNIPWMNYNGPHVNYKDCIYVAIHNWKCGDENIDDVAKILGVL